MAWTLTTSGSAIYKAGANASAIAIASGSMLLKWSDEVEGLINARTRHDWIATPATTNFLGSLSNLASDLIAIRIINYDMSGYTSRSEAQTMLDVLYNDADTEIKDILEKEYQSKML